MSIIRCDKHDHYYDSDFETECPFCDNREIETMEDLNAPFQNRWRASREDWDLGDKFGYGATKEEAISDLKENEE